MYPVAEIASNRYTNSVMDVWKKGYEPRHAFVNESVLALVARAIAEEELKVPDWKIPGVYPEDHRAFVTHNFWLNTVNFAFTLFGGKYAKYQLPGNPMFVGAFACAAALMRGFKRQVLDHVFDATGMDAVANILLATHSLKRTKRFFRGINSIPMAGERREHLRYAAGVLLLKYDGDPWNILEAADWHAYEHDGKRGIVNLLLRDFVAAFEDRNYVQLYPERSHAMYFMKRAQLWPLMLHGRALASGGELPLIRDAHKIGPVADYAVPNALRHLCILEYTPELAQAIDARREIMAGSDEEINIRAAQVVAMVELLRAANREREARGLEPITMVELDYKIWSLGRKAKYLHHLTRTTAY